jgi:glucan phosphorylase
MAIPSRTWLIWRPLSRPRPRAVPCTGKPEAWAWKAIRNDGHAGTFSNDRTMTEDAADIWQARWKKKQSQGTCS